MRKIREVLRLRFEVGLSARQVAASLSVGRASVSVSTSPFCCQRPYLAVCADWRRAAAAPAVPSDQRPMPDWAHVHAELRRPGVTLALLWQEYRLARLQASSTAGSASTIASGPPKTPGRRKAFVDYAGQTVPVIDQKTGEIRQTQIFVAVLGGASYTFAEATWSQKLPDWLGSHVRGFAFLGGTSQILVPENLRSGVTKAYCYEPDTNPSYSDLAGHYGVAVLPARSCKPRDKAKVEVSVQVVECWILAVLRNRQFFSLGELNAAISLPLDWLNH